MPETTANKNQCKRRSQPAKGKKPGHDSHSPDASAWSENNGQPFPLGKKFSFLPEPGTITRIEDQVVTVFPSEQRNPVTDTLSVTGNGQQEQYWAASIRQSKQTRSMDSPGINPEVFRCPAKIIGRRPTLIALKELAIKELSQWNPMIKGSACGIQGVESARRLSKWNVSIPAKKCDIWGQCGLGLLSRRGIRLLGRIERQPYQAA